MANGDESAATPEQIEATKKDIIANLSFGWGTTFLLVGSDVVTFFMGMIVWLGIFRLTGWWKCKRS